MSVEEARDAIADQAMICEGGCDDNCPNIYEDLDRLVLEVQAEMPCYHEALCGDDCDHVIEWTDGGFPAPDCPSCTARQQLAKVPV